MQYFFKHHQSSLERGEIYTHLLKKGCLETWKENLIKASSEKSHHNVVAEKQTKINKLYFKQRNFFYLKGISKATFKMFKYK